MTHITTDLREAACLITAAALPFELSFTERVLGDSTTGESLLQVVVKDREEQPGNPKTSVLRRILPQWKNGALPPTHPLKIKWRACLNFDALRKWQHDAHPRRLRAYANDQFFLVEPGDEPLRLTATVACRTNDFNLAAALSVVGIPILDIALDGPSRYYGLPAVGHPRCRPDWEGYCTETTAALIQRAGDPAKPLDLLIERTDPAHPVSLGYDALHCYAHLRHRARQIRDHGTLLVSLPKYTHRQALISSHATGRVLDKIQPLLGLPPGE